MRFCSLSEDLIVLLSNLFFPTVCPVCEKKPDFLQASPFCSACWSLIAGYSGPCCRICSLPLPSEHSVVCGACLKVKPPYSRVLSFGIYDGVLASAIHQFKFYSRKNLTKPLAAFLLTLDFPSMDGIIPVPLHKKSLKNRGFNQSLLLAKVVSERLRVPLYMDILFKIKETQSQVGLSAKDRLTNVRNAFVVKGAIKDFRLLLVDDVMTTGATVTECAKQLIKAGAKEVTVLTLARAGML